MYTSRPVPGRLAAGIAATLVVFIVLLVVVLLADDDDLPACRASRTSGLDIVAAGPRPCVLHGLTVPRGGATETAPAGQKNSGVQGSGGGKQPTGPKAPPRKELSPPKAPPAPAAPRPPAPAPKSR